MNMFKQEMKDIKTAVILFLFLTLLTGVIYPLVVTGVAQLFFPKQANGSLIHQGERTVGSLLIGQSFTEPKYFWGRPSATTPFPYNGESSSGSNMGPSNPAYLNLIKERAVVLRKFNLNKTMFLPIDLLTASGSGLDPEISPLAAFYQVSRIAQIRNIKEADLIVLINKHIINRSFGIFGEPRVNVLQLNLALDRLGASYG